MPDLTAPTRNPRVRANGEDSVYRITMPDGGKRWKAARTVAVDGRNAKRVTGSGMTREDALRRLDKNYLKYLKLTGAEVPGYLTARTNSVSALPNRTTVAEVAEQWIAFKEKTTVKAEQISPGTLDQYQRALRLHILPALGEHPIRLITTEQLNDFIHVKLPAKRKTRKDENGVIIQTSEPLMNLSHLGTIQGVLSGLFAWAKRRSFVSVNPMLNVDRVEKPRTVDRDLENRRGDVPTFIEFLEGKPFAGYWILACYGVRQSERLGLTWDCFKNLDDPEKATVEIKQQLYRNRKTGKLYISPDLKTKASYRVIPLDDRVRRAIRNHKVQQQKWKAQPTWAPAPEFKNIVFTDETGNPIPHANDNRVWHKVWADAGLKRMKHHDLRHLAISILVSSGAPLEVVRRIAGHTNIDITSGIYTHINTEDKQTPIRKLTDAMFRSVDAKAKGASRAQSDLAAIKKAKKKTPVG